MEFPVDLFRIRFSLISGLWHIVVAENNGASRSTFELEHPVKTVGSRISVKFTSFPTRTKVYEISQRVSIPQSNRTKFPFAGVTDDILDFKEVDQTFAAVGVADLRDCGARGREFIFWLGPGHKQHTHYFRVDQLVSGRKSLVISSPGIFSKELICEHTFERDSVSIRFKNTP